MAMLRGPVDSSDHPLGPDDAPITLVEYGDYQCPHCARAYPVLEGVRGHFGTKLRFGFRHFPLTENHPYAQAAPESAEYAGAQGRFWEMHDLLYANQDQLDTSLLFALVQSLGLSGQGLREALTDHTFIGKVRRDFLSGVRSGVNGTPTLFINDLRYDGLVDYVPLVASITASG